MRKKFLFSFFYYFGHQHEQIKYGIQTTAIPEATRGLDVKLAGDTEDKTMTLLLNYTEKGLPH